MVQLSVTQETKASPESIWALLADASSWQTWSAMDETRLERPGAGERDGVGAIRWFRTGSIVSREEVVEFDAPRRLSYTLVSGLPLRDYLASFTLAPSAAGGTTITWESSFRPPVPGTGWIYGYMLRRFVVKLLAALAAAAEREPARKVA